jgi:hypothetical protein
VSNFLKPGESELSQLDSAIVTREFAAKLQEDLNEQELMTMLTPVHVENSGPFLGSSRTVREHYCVNKR